MLAIYTRLSQEDDENNSINNQIREGKAFAKKANLPFEIYNEGEGVSGWADIKDRPVLDKLIKDIATDNITAVWFRNQNRLERNGETFHVFSSLAKQKKLRVVIGDKEVNWSDPNNFLQSKIMSAISEYQAELQSYQTKKSLLDNAREGKAFGITPYGYTTDVKGYFIINEVEAKIVKRIYSLSLEGKGTRAISEVLNNESIPTRYNIIKKGTITVKNKYTGKETTRNKSEVQWAQNTVRGILTNTLYKGERKWGNESFNLPQLRIFDTHYWQKVNDNLAKNARNRGKSVDHKYLLKGLLECSICGRNYYGRTRTNKKDNYYMCSSKRYKTSTCKNRSINIDVLESFIWESLFEGDILFTKMVITFNEEGTHERRSELKVLIKAHEKEIKKLADKENNRVQAVIDGEITKEQSQAARLRITRAEIEIKDRLRNDSKELYDLQSETRIIEEIVYDFSKDFEDPLLKQLEERYPEGKERYMKLTLENLENQGKAQLKSIATYNEKKKLLLKYVKRILIKYDYENKLFVLIVKYNLPIDNETYLIDSNYIFSYNVENEKMSDWHYDYGRRFTPLKISETIERLKGYIVIS
jgi:site-specific DNA recombinase